MKNAIISSAIVNRGFATQSITATQLSADVLTNWHSKLDTLLKVAYTAYVATHDDTIPAATLDLSPVFTAFKDALALVNTDDDCKIKCDGNTARTIISYSVKNANDKSEELKEAESVKRQLTAGLKGLEKTNGVSEVAIQSMRDQIEAQQKVIDGIKALSGAVQKQDKQVGSKTFYKLVEDYLADLALGNQMKSQAQIEAEAEAKKQARSAKQKAKRQQAAADKKKQHAQQAQAQSESVAK